MIWADEEIVRNILQHYEDMIFQVFHGGWERFPRASLGGRLLFLGRSRACLVHDFMVQRAISACRMTTLRPGDPSRTKQRNLSSPIKCFFGSRKADDRGLGSNIPTQASMNFVEQQQELPGIPTSTRSRVVYMLNRLQTQIDRVVVVARDGDERLWDYVILRPMTADVVSLPMAPNAELVRGHGSRSVRLKTPIKKGQWRVSHGHR